MCRSRAPIRAALRFVEIANMAICDRNSPAVLREHAQFGPQWFVMSVHSPQQTINNWAPRAVTVVSQAKISDESSLSRTGMAGQKPPEERERVCAFRGCGLVGSRDSRYGHLGHPHDTTFSRPAASKCEPRARTVHTLHIAGRGWHISGLVSVATSTAVLGALVSLGCEETLSTSAVSYPSVWPAWTVCYCSLCLSASGARLVYAQLPQHALRTIP